MSYEEAAIRYIKSTPKFGGKPGLSRLKFLLVALGNPHRKLKYIHIAGTNGKGSTAAFISSILMEAGYRVGIFTSPSIQRYSERIRVNNTEIPLSDMARIIERTKRIVEQMKQHQEDDTNEFELLTMIAFQYFNEQKCDIVVLETGLGGRIDATNIINTPEVAVITTINYDHTEVLGDTLSEIAFEKAGIIKEEGDVVLYPQEAEVESVFKAVCDEKKAKLHKIDFSGLALQSYNHSVQTFDYESLEHLQISLLGEYQIKNAVVAIKTIEILNGKGYKIDEPSLKKGLLKTKWPGRFEVIHTSPLFLVDSSHNVEGAITLVENLKKYFPKEKITFIVGFLSDKDYIHMIEAVIPIAKRIITVTPEDSRALDAQDLEKIISKYPVDVRIGGSVNEAVQMSLDLTSENEIICSFGSLYYIGKVREHFGLS